MANYGGFLAGGLADLGSQVATGLLGGQELLAREEERRAKLAQSQFLNRLREVDLVLKQRELTKPTVHGQYLLDPNGLIVGMLPLDPLQRAHAEQSGAAQRASEARTKLDTEKLKRIDQPQPQADPIIARFQQGIQEAQARGDEATVAKLESALGAYARALHGATPGKPEKPNVHVSHQTDEKGNVVEIITRVDPSTGKVTTETKSLGKIGKPQAAASGADFSSGALEMYAQAVADGAAMPGLGMGKASTEARIKISNRAAEIRAERGDLMGSLAIRQANYRANASALAKVTTQEAQIRPFSLTAKDSLQRAKELSAKIDRTGVPVINRWIMAGRKSVTGDPDVAAFDYHLRLGINEVAKITSSATGGGGVVSDHARAEIESTLNNSMTRQQIESVIQGAQYEMDSRLRHIAEEKALLRGAMSSAPASPPAPVTPTIRDRARQGDVFPLGQGGGPSNDPLGIRR